MSSTQTLERGRFLGAVGRRFAAGGISLAEIRHTSAASLPRHVHREAFFSLLLYGEYSDIGATATRELEPLTLTFAPRDFEHADRVGRSGARFFTVSLDSAIMGALDASGPGLQRPGYWRQDDVVLVFLRLYTRLLSRGDELDQSSVLDGVVHALGLAGSVTDRAERQPAWVRRGREQIHDSLDLPLTVIQLAHGADVHPVHFSRVFQRAFGCGPAEYRARARTHRACELLATTQLDLATVAIRLGFSDQSHMTRVFRRRVGVPPGAYRALVAG